MAETILACVDCKHYYRTWRMKICGEVASCARNYTPKVDLVTGKMYSVNSAGMPSCRHARDDDRVYSETCGKEGKHWSPRNATPETTLLLLKRETV